MAAYRKLFIYLFSFLFMALSCMIFILHSGWLSSLWFYALPLFISSLVSRLAFLLAGLGQSINRVNAHFPFHPFKTGW